MAEWKEDELMRGAIDLHAHGTEYHLGEPGRVDDIEWAQKARDCGMSAFVVKSHIWPTTERAYFVNRAVSGIKVFGAIALNTSVGGLSPFAVECVAKLGTKIVWMPTWTAKHDIENKGFNATVLKVSKASIIGKPQMIINAKDEIIPEVKEILSLIKQYDMILATGHISPKESLILAEEAKQIGISKMIFTHPMIWIVGASIEDMKEMSKKGAYVEYTFVSTMPMHLRPDYNLAKILEAMKSIGFEHSIMSTDACKQWNPSPPEMMRMYISSMLGLGVHESDIKKMVSENPARLLGI